MRRRDFTLSLWPSPATTIVADEPDRRAAIFLQTYLRRVFGSAGGFDIRASALGSGSTIEFGRAALHRDGFAIRTSGSRTQILGGGSPGAMHGAAAFLDRFAGVRFYMPGELFTVVPRRSRLEVPDGEIVEEPYVQNCMMSGVGGYLGTGGTADSGPRPDERNWLERNAAFRKESVGFSHQHSMYQRFPPDRFAARYPEIYPILAGKRHIPADPKDQRWQPCLSAPSLVDAAEESAVDYFRAHPDLRLLSFSVQDSRVHCQCDRCAAQEKLVGNAVDARSRMNARFLNALAERLERRPETRGRTLVYIAYSDVRAIPDFRLHPNVVPVVVFTIGDALIDKVLEPGGLADSWGSAVAAMGNHDWGQGSGYFIPRTYAGLMARFFRHMKSKGIRWAYQHMEGYPNWGFDGPKLYLAARIWWNPDVDVDALWRRLCDDLFPAARAEMLGYFQTLEELWISMDDLAERKIRKWSNQFLLSDPQRPLVARARRHLGRALAQSRGLERRRVDLFSDCFRLSELFFDVAERKDAARIGELRAHAAKLAAEPMAHYLSGDAAAMAREVEAALAVIGVPRTP